MMGLLFTAVFVTAGVIKSTAAGTFTGTWSTFKDKALTCSASEYKGDLGHFTDAAGCGAAVKARADVNYGLWRGQDTQDCYACAITDRGDPASWKYADMTGATSFAGAGVLPPAPAPTPAPGSRGNCRIHTDPGANSSAYPWRNAYTPKVGQQHVRHGAESTPLDAFVTHEYGICSRGAGPYNYSDTNSTVEQCAAKCTELNCTCFDISCPYHEAADCQCPQVPSVSPATSAKRVAAVGDSITAGYLSSCGLTYPAQLQTLLGAGFRVQNFGVGGTTMLREADHPYWNTSAYADALAFAPDIVVLMLGTNDAKRDNWGPGGRDLASQFPDDYTAMINSFTSLSSQPTVHVMVPPPLYYDGCYGMNQSVINSVFPRLVPDIASRNGLAAPIDLYGLYQKHCPVIGGTPGHENNSTDVFCDWIGSGGVDGCHPDNTGYGKIAEAVMVALSAASDL